MNGRRQTPSGRPADDADKAAFLAAPSTVQPSVRAPNPPPWQERGRHRSAPRSPVSHLELGPLASAVPSARVHARLVVQEWGFGGEFVEVVELLVSELTTNAVLASQALKTFLPSPIHLWLKPDHQRVTAVVWDGNPGPPVLKEDVPVDAEGGRGLLLVQVMSERWGWTPTPDSGGKSVWCIVAQKSAT